MIENKDLKSTEFLKRLKHCGKEVKIFEKAQLVKPELISVDDYSIINDFVWILGEQEVNIGRRVHIAVFSSITGGGKCYIEDYAGLSTGCRIITGTDDYSGNSLMNPCIPMEYRKVSRSYVRLCRFVTLATNVIVMPGVTIGEGTLVLAGSIVTTDLESWGVYIGAPVKRIRERESKPILDMVEKLEKKYG